MSFLKGLVFLECFLFFLATLAPADPSIVNITSKVGGYVGTNVFFRPLLVYVMTGNEHDMSSKFLMIKPLVFLGYENEGAY